MSVRRFLLSGLVVPVAAALALSTAEAQVRSSWNGPGTGSFEVPWNGASPVAFEGYYTHYRLDGDGDDRVGMNGLGARLMWRPTSRDSLGVVPRFGLGVFGEYAPADDLGFSLLHAGVQSDLLLVSQPWFGRVTPIASLGAGVLHANGDDPLVATATRVAQRARSMTTLALAPVAGISARSSTTFALSPAAGAKVALWREFGLRADARDLLTFRGGARHNLQLTAGLSFPF